MVPFVNKVYHLKLILGVSCIEEDQIESRFNIVHDTYLYF